MNTNKIRIENWNPFNLSIRSNLRDYLLSPISEDGTPSMEYLTLEEVLWIDSNNNAIRTGFITINKDDRDEVFKAMKFEDGDKILTNKEAEDIFINPSLDGLTKIISVTDIGTFDRIYAVFTGLKEGGSVDISNRVINLMNERYKEMKRGILKSRILVEKKDTEQEITPTRAKELESQNQKLQDELSELKEMMKQFMSQQTAKTEAAEPTKKTTTTKRTAKK